MSFNFSKILVTGGAGFIGSIIVDQLLGEGLQFIVLDDLSTVDKMDLVAHKS